MILDVQGSKSARMARRSWDICSLDWCGEVSFLNGIESFGSLSHLVPTSPHLCFSLISVGELDGFVQSAANCCPKVMP